MQLHPLRPLVRLLSTPLAVARSCLHVAFWLLASMLVSGLNSLSIFVVGYHVAVIAFDLVLFCCGAVLKQVLHALEPPSTREESILHRAMLHARSFTQWQLGAAELDRAEGNDAWKESTREGAGAECAVGLLQETRMKLQVLREQGRVGELTFLMRSGCLARDFAGLDNQRLFLHSHVGTKRVVDEFRAELARCLRYLCDYRRPAHSTRDSGGGGGGGVDRNDRDDGNDSDSGRHRHSDRAVSPTTSTAAVNSKLNFTSTSTTASTSTSTTTSAASAAASTTAQLPLQPPSSLDSPPSSPSASFGDGDKIEFFYHALHTLGRSALCLSGGGSLTMYHLGTVKCLIEEGVMPGVVSGTSGGAICAGMLAIHTDEEMVDDIIKVTPSGWEN